MSTLKTRHGSGSCEVLCVLANLEDDPLLLVVGAPYSAFMLEPGSPSLCRRVYAPFVEGGGGESSWTVPLSMRLASACSSMGLVVKGHTGALFLLSVMVVAALLVDLLDMK